MGGHQARERRRGAGALVRVAIVNEIRDADVNDAAVAAIVAALNEQAIDFAEFWQRAPIEVYAARELAAIDVNDAPLALVSTSDVPEDLGYHAIQASGRPFGICAWGPVKASGGAVLTGADAFSVTVSHEYLELIVNPYVTAWIDTPEGDQEPFEICDRVQGDAYPLEQVSVSNFLGPRAFSQGPGPFDFMRLLTSPREVRPGGYVAKRAGGVDAPVRYVYGEKCPQWRRVLLENPSALSRAGRRVW